MKKHNFSAGPAILPASVIQEAAQGILDFNGSGLSILEVSHRGAAFMSVMDEAMELVRELLDLPADYEVMFLSGGASTQFFMAPMNLIDESDTACYVDTGTWASKAIKEAKAFGKVEVSASSKADNYTHIPQGFEVPNYAKYLHLTSNNTIYGTQYHWWPDPQVPIVCDMSSDIFSRPIDISRFGLIYAGAQKNMGAAGVTLVVVKKDMLGTVHRHLPAMLDYRLHIENGSMYNTPPVYAVYIAMLTMRWIKANGGLRQMEQLNQRKAQLLYEEIDANPCFVGTTRKEDRSLMNVTFLAAKPEWEQPFLDACKAAGCVDLKGHRSVGGFRASIYNAMPLEGVQALVDVMREFASKVTG